MPIDFVHFEVYYNAWQKTFNKPSDPLVLFYHFCMIQNRFKLLVNSKLTELLPDKWNESNDSYTLYYQRHGVKYRLEIGIIKQMAHVTLRRMEDYTDHLQHISVMDYVNGDDFKPDTFKSCYKSMDQFYKRVKWSVAHFNSSKRAFEEQRTDAETSDAITSREKSSNLINRNGAAAATTTTTSVRNISKLTYSDIINYMKEEKQDLDASVDAFYRRGNSSAAASSSLMAAAAAVAAGTTLNDQLNKRSRKETISQLTPEDIEFMAKKIDSAALAIIKNKSAKANSKIDEQAGDVNSSELNAVGDDTRLQSIGYVSETTEEPASDATSATGTTSTTSRSHYFNQGSKTDVARIPRSDLFDYNPITNYFFKKTVNLSNLDEKCMSDDEVVREYFRKYNLKCCNINLVDCFNSEPLRGHWPNPVVHLTAAMKEALQLVERPGASNTSISKADKQKAKKKDYQLVRRIAIGTASTMGETTVRCASSSSPSKRVFKKSTFNRLFNNKRTRRNKLNSTVVKPSASLIETISLVAHTSASEEINENDSVAANTTNVDSTVTNLATALVENTNRQIIRDPLSVAASEVHITTEKADATNRRSGDANEHDFSLSSPLLVKRADRTFPESTTKAEAIAKKTAIDDASPPPLSLELTSTIENQISDKESDASAETGKPPSRKRKRTVEFDTESDSDSMPISMLARKLSCTTIPVSQSGNQVESSRTCKPIDVTSSANALDTNNAPQATTAPQPPLTVESRHFRSRIVNSPSRKMRSGSSCNSKMNLNNTSVKETPPANDLTTTTTIAAIVKGDTSLSNAAVTNSNGSSQQQQENSAPIVQRDCSKECAATEEAIKKTSTLLSFSPSSSDKENDATAAPAPTSISAGAVAAVAFSLVKNKTTAKTNCASGNTSANVVDVDGYTSDAHPSKRFKRQTRLDEFTQGFSGGGSSVNSSLDLTPSNSMLTSPLPPAASTSTSGGLKTAVATTNRRKQTTPKAKSPLEKTKLISYIYGKMTSTVNKTLSFATSPLKMMQNAASTSADNNIASSNSKVVSSVTTTPRTPHDACLSPAATRLSIPLTPSKSSLLPSQKTPITHKRLAPIFTSGGDDDDADVVSQIPSNSDFISMTKMLSASPRFASTAFQEFRATHQVSSSFVTSPQVSQNQHRQSQTLSQSQSHKEIDGGGTRDEGGVMMMSKAIEKEASFVDVINSISSIKQSLAVTTDTNSL